MSFVAVDKNGTEYIYQCKPIRYSDFWVANHGVQLRLPKGSINALIGREITWNNEPVQIGEYDKQ